MVEARSCVSRVCTAQRVGVLEIYIPPIAIKLRWMGHPIGVAGLHPTLRKEREGWGSQNFLGTELKMLLRSGLSGVFEFFVPGLLDGFENAFIGLRRIAHKPWQFSHILVQVSEPDGVGIDVGKLLLQLNANLFGICPVDLTRHGFSPLHPF